MEAGLRTHLRSALRVRANVSRSRGYLALPILMFSQAESL